MIRIGVTGHRNLTDPLLISEGIQKVLKKIRRIVRNDNSETADIIILSSLAEGTDRIVAREILAAPPSELEAVLPLDPAEYLKDFASSSSRREFRDFLQKASKTHIVRQRSTRSEAYGKAGRFVVDNCDILIAVWDGQAGRGKGGTADMVDYARKTGKPLFWINAANPTVIKEERIDGQ
jgi:hypothetical protein